MQVNREKRVELVNKNIRQINEFLTSLSSSEIDLLLQKMEDIFYFYGFKKETVQTILRKNKIELDFSSLTDIEGVMNAILFHLKYKSNIKTARSKDSTPTQD